MKICILQGSVATRLKCGGMLTTSLQIFAECDAKGIFQVGEHVVNILTQVSWHVFMAHGEDHIFRFCLFILT